MKRLSASLLLLLWCCTPAVSVFAADGTFDTPQAAAADPDFALQGEYAADGVGVQVVALGDGMFQIVKYPGGLPGAGWTGPNKEKSEGDAVAVKSAVAQLKRTDRQSPTMGAKPPAGAVVLFDGTKESLDKHWKPGAKMTEDGLLMQGCTGVDSFQGFTLHLEFRLPYMPKARGQARANSGLYVQGRYECQMLDSFGLEGENNECGGIYTIAKPLVNMCLPPLVWQSYDVDFTAGQFDGGKKTKGARTTIRHNGVKIHDDLELPNGTPGGPLAGEGPEPGPVYLQDHGNPVRYRNIWIQAK